jgi:hypothetical protein
MRPLPRRSILHLIDSFSALSKRPPPRRWAVRRAIGLLPRHWAIRIIIGWSDGPMRRRWVLCVVHGPYASSSGAPWCRWALRVVIVLSMGPVHCRWTL